MHNIWEWWVKFGQSEDCSLGDSTQITLRHCSKEAVGKGQYIRFWWRESSVQSSTYFTKDFLLVTRRWRDHEGIWCFPRYEEMQGLGSWKQFLKISNYLKTCSTSFPGAECLSLHPGFPSGNVEGQQLQQSRQMANALVMVVQLLKNALGKCPFVVDRQVPTCSWQF